MQTKEKRNIGIVALDIYFPKTSVRQEDLEAYDNVPKGKYTVGLGQNSMSFVGDREDIVSICLTAVTSFFEKYRISPQDIGRLEVGTESVIDKSKSIKTYLMQLFKSSGNYDVEGVDNTNACYGATNALLNSIHWIESSSWDGRYALVVGGDIAVYKKGPARPTGGCGAVVMLVGVMAPLSFESGLRGSYFDHVYDFYKPELSSEYPTVSGEFSIQCYMTAIEGSYERYCSKFLMKYGREFSLDDIDYIVFHAPYNKLISKAFCRIFYMDYLRNPNGKPEYEGLSGLKGRELDTELLKRTKDLYKEKVEPSVDLSKELGNLYCGSLYAGLVSLINTKRNSLVGKRIVLFSYGSGLASTMFSVQVTQPLDFIISKLNVNESLANRTFVHPQQFHDSLALRELRYLSKGYEPTDSLETLFPGTYYLEKVDDQFRRFYKRSTSVCQLL